MELSNQAKFFCVLQPGNLQRPDMGTQRLGLRLRCIAIRLMVSENRFNELEVYKEMHVILPLLVTTWWAGVLTYFDVEFLKQYHHVRTTYIQARQGMSFGCVTGISVSETPA